MRDAHRIVVGKPEGKGPRVRPSRRREDNIKTNLQQIRWESVNSSNIAQDREMWRALLNAVINIQVP
jgi:hypothetical protein